MTNPNSPDSPETPEHGANNSPAQPKGTPSAEETGAQQTAQPETDSEAAPETTSDAPAADGSTAWHAGGAGAQQPQQSQPQWGQQYPQWNQSQNQSTQPPQWAQQPQQYQQPQWGQQSQQYQQQPQWGQQPQQWQQQPYQGGQPQWGQQPQQGPSAQQWGGSQFQQQPQQGGQQSQWGQTFPAAPAAAKTPRNLPAWPVWTYGGLLLLNFITSFMAVISVSYAVKRVGALSFKFNWWGVGTFTGSGVGTLGDSFFNDSYDEAFGDTQVAMTIVTIFILLLFALATFFAFKRNWKLAAIVGTVAAAIQLIDVLLSVGDLNSDVYYGYDSFLGAGWWMWLLLSIVGLAISAALLLRGKDKLDQTFAKARSSVNKPGETN